MALRTTIEHLDYNPKYDFALSPYTVTPVLQTEDRVRPVFDDENGIFIVAVEGSPTEENIERAMVALRSLRNRTWRDVLAIAFAGNEIPTAAVREALAKMSISVVIGQTATRATAKALHHRKDLLALRQPQAAATAQGLQAA